MLDSVRLRMISDVPVGALLSGGVDSSAVVALMQEVTERPVKTDTIGFDEAEHDESQHARMIAQHIVRKIGFFLKAGSRAETYRSLMSAWQDPDRVVRGSDGFFDRADEIVAGFHHLSLVERMMVADQTTYLPDDLLAKVDRASMAVSLEARVPILDHRVVELSWRMPQDVKIRSGVTKWALRQVL